MLNFRTIALLLAFTVFIPYAQTETIPRLEAYFMSGQVRALLASPEDRTKALQVLQEIGVTKVYLESIRDGVQPTTELLETARDFFQEHGIEASGGVTLISGNDFSTASDQPGLWLNYQTEKTRKDVAEHFRTIAAIFDEIMVDDFLATDDTSAISQQDKGDRTWSQYRLDLMSDFAKRYMIEPARAVNPDVKIIIKYPQWYDRFHKFGYDVVREPKLFNRVWVGTETRNPETKRYGYVMPTEGYINFSWLKSTAGKKIGGGWYDFGDCTKETYLMQAYQTVLAGAKELVLFEAGSLIQGNPCNETFLKRRDALFSLGEIVKDRKPMGICAYKPPHSNGSDTNGAGNLYVYDYLATLGLAPIPVAKVPDSAKTIFLPRQAADDPGIKDLVHTWLTAGKTLWMTPDFLCAVKDQKITAAAGFEYPLVLALGNKKSDWLWWTWH